MKVSEIIKRVRFVIKDENYEEVKHDWIITDIIQSSLNEILSQTKIIEDIVPISVSSSVGYLPDDFIVIKNIYDSNGNEIRRVSMDYYQNQKSNQWVLNTPVYVYLKPNKLLFIGIDSGTCFAHIYKTIKITDENDDINIPMELISVLVYKTAIELYISGRISPAKIPASLVEVWMSEVQNRLNLFKMSRIEEDRIDGVVKEKRSFFK
jgi:hypothetical protein